jgi:hypothetical protein
MIGMIAGGTGITPMLQVINISFLFMIFWSIKYLLKCRGYSFLTKENKKNERIRKWEYMRP